MGRGQAEHANGINLLFGPRRHGEGPKKTFFDGQKPSIQTPHPKFSHAAKRLGLDRKTYNGDWSGSPYWAALGKMPAQWINSGAVVLADTKTTEKFIQTCENNKSIKETLPLELGIIKENPQGKGNISSPKFIRDMTVQNKKLPFSVNADFIKAIEKIADLKEGYWRFEETSKTVRFYDLGGKLCGLTVPVNI